MNQSETAIQNPLGTKPLKWLIPHYAISATIALVVNALMVAMISVTTLWGDGCASFASLQQGKGNERSASIGVCNTFCFSLLMGIIFMIASLNCKIRIEEFCNHMLAVYGALSKYGADITVAAFGITIKIYQVVLNVVQGFVTGAQPIMGYNNKSQLLSLQA